MEISIISTFNQDDLNLRRSISSVLNQTFLDWEWIISIPKNSIDVISYFEEINDPRIKINVLPDKISKINLYNSALAISEGRFICYYEEANIWKPDYLKIMHLFLINTPFEMVYCTYDNEYVKNSKLVKTTYYANNKISLYSAINFGTSNISCFMYDSKFIGKMFFKIGNFNYRQIMWLELLRSTKFCAPMEQNLSKSYKNPKNFMKGKIFRIYTQYQLYREYLKYSRIKSFTNMINWLYQ